MHPSHHYNIEEPYQHPDYVTAWMRPAGYKCKHCHTVVPYGAKYCRQCGLGKYRWPEYKRKRFTLTLIFLMMIALGMGFWLTGDPTLRWVGMLYVPGTLLGLAWSVIDRLRIRAKQRRRQLQKADQYLAELSSTIAPTPPSIKKRGKWRHV